VRKPIAPKTKNIFITIAPFALIAMFVVSTFLIVRSVQTQGQDTRSRAGSVYPLIEITARVTLPDPYPTKTKAEIEMLLKLLGDGTKVSGGCGGSSIAIGPGNDVYGCGGDGKWHDLTKGDAYTKKIGLQAGIGPEYLTVKPVWLEGSKTLAAAIKNAEAAKDYSDLVEAYHDVGLIAPTPNIQGSPCGGNEDTLYSSGAIAVGPSSNGNSTWQCSNGAWKPCVNCIITEVPSYLQNIDAFKNAYLIGDAEKKIFNDAYNECIKTHGSESCRDTSTTLVNDDRLKRALDAYAAEMKKPGGSIVAASNAALKIGISEAQINQVAQNYIYSTALTVKNEKDYEREKTQVDSVAQKYAEAKQKADECNAKYGVTQCGAENAALQKIENDPLFVKYQKGITNSYDETSATQNYFAAKNSLAECMKNYRPGACGNEQSQLSAVLQSEAFKKNQAAIELLYVNTNKVYEIQSMDSVQTKKACEDAAGSGGKYHCSDTVSAKDWLISQYTNVSQTTKDYAKKQYESKIADAIKKQQDIRGF
jgi:hypothetical protein